MYLLIDMSELDKIHLVLFDEKTKIEKSFEDRNRELLFCIDKILVENGLDKNSIQGIMVVVGAGSFTSTRIACVVANSFAYAMNISLLAISVKHIVNVEGMIPELLNQPKGQFISATYSGEPNIGYKKIV